MTERLHGPIRELTKARLRELIREPEIVFWVFAFPILLTLALGIAFRTQGAADLSVGIVEGTGAAAVRTALNEAGGVQIRLLAPAEIDAALRDGRVQIVILPGDPPTYVFDSSRPEGRLARGAVDDALQTAAGRSDVWRAVDRHLTSPGARYIDWLVPGLLGMNVMGTSLWGIGFGIVNARMRKLLKRLMATPMRRVDYLASYLLARLVFLAAEVIALLGFAWLVFRMPVHGSFAVLAVVALTGALAFGGLGLLVASRAQTIEAVSGLLNVVMLPMWIFSGVFFSYANFPEALHPVIRLLPLTALNDALRGVMLEGSSLIAVGSELAVLSMWGIGTFFAALQVFKWR